MQASPAASTRCKNTGRASDLGSILCDLIMDYAVDYEMVKRLIHDLKDEDIHKLESDISSISEDRVILQKLKGDEKDNVTSRLAQMYQHGTLKLLSKKNSFATSSMVLKIGTEKTFRVDFGDHSGGWMAITELDGKSLQASARRLKFAAFPGDPSPWTEEEKRCYEYLSDQLQFARSDEKAFIHVIETLCDCIDCSPNSIWYPQLQCAIARKIQLYDDGNDEE
mmetsp:Transcript_27828/g.54130  ORF Transcript_27828/g.54130 Transcript_27828/m.54130 type:complete len:223 (+) Transcript_27828:78-746(+)